MSRLIVKGLPSNCTEEKLRNHFKSFGNITDCSLKYTRDGKFRRFAFVGFERDENAQEACENLHNTFMGASRLTVEIMSCLIYVVLLEIDNINFNETFRNRNVNLLLN